MLRFVPRVRCPLPHVDSRAPALASALIRLSSTAAPTPDPHSTPNSAPNSASNSAPNSASNSASNFVPNSAPNSNSKQHRHREQKKYVGHGHGTKATYEGFCQIHQDRDRPPTIQEALHMAAESLPHQGILENFIHHNPLRPLETDFTFDESLAYMDHLDQLRTPGERAFLISYIDPRKRVNETLVEYTSSFLDRGAAKWVPRYRNRGFLYFFARLETLGLPVYWRKGARREVRRLRERLEKATDAELDQISEELIKENLDALDVQPSEYANALRNILLELKGWAGMFHRMEIRPHEAPAETKVRLADFAAVHLILLRSSIEACAKSVGWRRSEMTLAAWLAPAAPTKILKKQRIGHSSSLATADQWMENRRRLESEFESGLLYAIQNSRGQTNSDTNSVNAVSSNVSSDATPDTKTGTTARPSLQVYQCMDDRAESFRRYIEEGSDGVETFGVAGFFGLAVRYKAADGRDETILAPDGNKPKVTLVEGKCPGNAANARQFDAYYARRKLLAKLNMWWERASFSPLGSLALSVFAPFTLARLAYLAVFPSSYSKTRDSLIKKIVPTPENDINIPYTPEEAAQLLAATFKNIGTHQRFAPIVIVMGHGSTSVNNPFFAAYNCGACGGREGGPNARLFARLANDPTIRQILAKDHGVNIPDDTHFIGSQHNTANDTVTYYDLNRLPASLKPQWESAEKLINEARGKNALERCHRFLLANAKSPQQALKEVNRRSVDHAEIRPELNHATNAAVLVGRRDLTKGLFLDRRALMPSYDPFSDDDRGTNLENVLGPALIVSSGINLEYLFSTTHHDNHGAGTKVPLNVVGNLGVLQGVMGDLRPGLPSQMTEMHTPLRALFLVDAPISRVEAVLSRRPELQNLVYHEWVRFFVRDPMTGRLYRQSNGEYLEMDPKTDLQAEHASHLCRLQPLDDLIKRTRKETVIWWAAFVGMIASCVGPIWAFGSTAMNPWGPLIALGGTALSLPMLYFMRRYMHGEFMFARVVGLSSALVLGFNLIAMAPNLEHLIQAWSLFGFASAFLIGAYNDRVTVRNNTTYVFAAYRLADFALLLSLAFASITPAGTASLGVAMGLLIAAVLKSSQFPMTSLFIRSMEGPTPTSALGYAGLSAHIGIVLLAGLMPLWYPIEAARYAIGGLGLITAIYGTLTSKIRADRKGAVANMTAATLGVLYIVLALGYPGLALFLSFGHAAFRMTQIVRAPNIINDSQNLKSALGFLPWPVKVPDMLYAVSWYLRRFKSDTNLTYLLHFLSRPLNKDFNWNFSKWQQWAITTVVVILAGFPYTPVMSWFEHLVLELIATHPWMAAGLMFGHFVFSVVLFRFLLMHVLNANRFATKFKNLNRHAKPTPKSVKSTTN